MIDLKNMKFDESCDLIANLCIELSEITEDVALVSELKELMTSLTGVASAGIDGMDIIYAFAKSTPKVLKGIAILSKSHKHNLKNIMALLEGVDVEVIENYSPFQQVKAIQGYIKNPDFLELFKCAIGSK